MIHIRQYRLHPGESEELKGRPAVNIERLHTKIGRWTKFHDRSAACGRLFLGTSASPVVRC